MIHQVHGDAVNRDSIYAIKTFLPRWSQHDASSGGQSGTPLGDCGEFTYGNFHLPAR